MKPNEKGKPRFDAAKRKSLGRLIKMLWQFRSEEHTSELQSR